MVSLWMSQVQFEDVTYASFESSLPCVGLLYYRSRSKTQDVVFAKDLFQEYQVYDSVIIWNDGSGPCAHTTGKSNYLCPWTQGHRSKCRSTSTVAVYRTSSLNLIRAKFLE